MDDGFTGISTDNRAVALKRFQYLMKWSGNADMTNRMLKIPIGNGNRRKKQAQFPSWTTKTINLKSPMENFNLKYIFPRS